MEADLLITLLFLLVLVTTLVVVLLIIRDTIRGAGIWGINFERVKCPRCGELAPARRRPTSFRQALWGGWTCRKCSCEMDKWGAEIKS